MDWECVDLGGFSGIVEPGCGLRVRNLRGSKPVLVFFFSFFRRDALKEQFGKEPSTVRCLAVKSALLGTRHPRKEKEAALQNIAGEPACLDGKIVMSTQSEREPSVKICKIEVRSSQPAGSPIHRASQGLLPGAPTKKGAAYLPYLERPTKPTSRGGVHTYIPIHTYLDY